MRKNSTQIIPNHPTELSAEDKQKLAAWMEGAEGKPGPRIIKEMFKRVNEEHGEDLYYAVYGRWSAYVHGNVLIFMDLIGGDYQGDAETHIRWQMKRFDPVRQIRWVLHCILWVVNSAERVSDRGKSFSRLRNQYESLERLFSEDLNPSVSTGPQSEQYR